MAASAKLEKVPKHPGIYRRGNRFVVTYRDLHGRARKRFVRTITEAEDLKASVRADKRRGEYRPESRITFAQYASKWIASYSGRTSTGVREATLADYRRRLGLDEDGRPRVDAYGRGVCAVGFFGRMRLTEIQPPHVKEYAKGLADRGFAPNTVRLFLAPVRALLATAFEDGLIRFNPAANVRVSIARPRNEDGEEAKVKALTEEELRKLLAEIRCVPCQREPKPGCAACERWRLFFAFLAHTGCRIGEAIALTWGHIDLGHCRVLVRRRWYRGSFDSPKSRYGRRDIPLSPGMARALWRLRASAADPELVFASATGGVLDQSNLARRVLKPAARRAGVPWCAYHSLRHTCATTLFRKGLNPKAVQMWLGHHSPAFTLSVYVHLLSDDLPDASFLDAVTAGGEGDAGATSVAFGLPSATEQQDAEPGYLSGSAKVAEGHATNF